MIQPYASRTGTRKNLDAMRQHGIRLMISATGVHRDEGMQYALDNGAWTAFQKSAPWDRVVFDRLMEKFGDGADFVVCPDVVANPTKTRKLYRQWLPDLVDICPVLVAMQDGMTPWDARDALHRGATGIFIGGMDEWKDKTLAMWGQFATLVGCYIHVGRVNTQRRISASIAAGVHSFDGTSPTKWAKNSWKIAAWASQMGLFDQESPPPPSPLIPLQP